MKYLSILLKEEIKKFPDITIRQNYEKMNIAIIGLGNIGSYLYKYLKTNKAILSKKIIVYQM